MRFAFIATLFGAIASAGALADVNTVVSTGIERFEKACGQAVTDPQGYVNSVPNPSALGSQTVSVSPDQQVVRVNHHRDGIEEEVVFIRMPGTLSVYCLTHSYQSNMNEQIHTMMSEEDFNRYSAELDQALLAYVSTRDDIQLAGGLTPIEYATSYSGQVFRQKFPNTYSYGFVLNADGVKVPSFIDIEAGGLGIHAVRIIEVTQ